MNLRPVARDVVLACAGAGPGDPEIKHEFFLEQVEVATRPCATSDDLRAQLVRGRQLVADTARPFGVVPVAAPVPVLAGSSGTPSPGKRYGRVRDTYGRIAEDSLYCALQVHVEVEDDEQAVGVLDRLRPWVPVLLAVSANSPYWRGSDTGFASWRSQLWDRWPSSGPREPFGTMAGYRRTVARLVTSGAILDEAMLNLDIRRSARFSTVELRLTDVCTDVDDAVALACLTRGLVAAAAEEWLRGASAPDHWSVGRLRVARDTAARNGLSGTLVHPVTRNASAGAQRPRGGGGTRIAGPRGSGRHRPGAGGHGSLDEPRHGRGTTTACARPCAWSGSRGRRPGCSDDSLSTDGPRPWIAHPRHPPRLRLREWHDPCA